MTKQQKQRRSWPKRLVLSLLAVMLLLSPVAAFADYEQVVIGTASSSSTADFTGIWKESDGHEFVYELKQSGSQVTGKFYESDGTYIGEYNGTASQNIAEFVWSRLKDGETISGKDHLVAQGDGSYYMKSYVGDGSLDYETILKRLTAVPTPPGSSQPAAEKPVPSVSETDDWKAPSSILRNTAEGELVVRTGDIDNLGYGYAGGEPFAKNEGKSHSYPYKPEADDPAGTDVIMKGSKAGVLSLGTDMYFHSAIPVVPIQLRYNLDGITIRSARLQLALDDFQIGDSARGGQVVAYLNGQEAPFLSAALQKFYSGTQVKLANVDIPAEYFEILSQGYLSILIDDSKGAKEGFGVDFVRLIINPTGGTVPPNVAPTATPPASSQQSSQHSAARDFMTGTWTFDSDTSYGPQGDMKAFVVQNGNTFSGTYNKNHFNEWQAGTISGTIEGNTVKGTMRFDSWYVKDGKYYEKGTWNFSFTWDPQKRTLRGSPSHVQMVKVSDQVESPRYSSIDSVRGGSSSQQGAVVSTSWSGTWEFATNWGKTVYVEQEGNTLYGTYYYSDGTIKGTFVGTVEGNVFKGTWCQNNKGTPDGGMIWTINADGTSKVEWGTGALSTGAMNSTGTTNKAKKISDTYPRDKIKRTQGLGTETAAPAPTPAPAPAPAEQVVIGTPSGPSPIPMTGGEQSTTTVAAPVSAGVSVSFNPTGAIGYRIFRSDKSGELGISVTDFYLTATSYADVNVEPNTTYYYTLKEVLAEAKPLQGVDEKLGRTLATWKTTTSPTVNQGFQGGGRIKHAIILKLDNPYMSVDGARSEVDPGRGTTPIVYRSRTMVPISAIVRAMGGNATWAGGVREVGLAANNNTVKMWIDKKDLTVNGSSGKMDVAPIIQNTRTFVPIRFAAENLKCKVDWLNSTKEIVIIWED